MARSRSDGSKKLVGRWRIQKWMFGIGTPSISSVPRSSNFVAISRQFRIHRRRGLDGLPGSDDERPPRLGIRVGRQRRMGQASGRGWAALQPDGSLKGHIYFHLGDDSEFHSGARLIRSVSGPVFGLPRARPVSAVKRGLFCASSPSG